jgi:plastocyanin
MEREGVMIGKVNNELRMTDVAATCRGLAVLAVLGFSALAPGSARAQDKPGAPSWTDFQKLEQELRDQRQLILQLMQNEQQRYDLLLKLIQSGGNAVQLPPGSPASKLVAPDAQLRPAAVAEAARARPVGFGSISGTVKISGGDPGPVYVYVRNVSGSPVKNHTLEIKQEGKQFIPGHAVVQTGTTLSFPNLDGIFHNVFSNSSGNAFDLGTYRSGDAPRTVTVTRPGVVDVQCNIHEQMRARVLVVPSGHFTKVRPDGSFRLDGVPAGRRKLVAWGPNLKPAQHTVDVSTGGVQANFALQAGATKVLPNKIGQAYGSYE